MDDARKGKDLILNQLVPGGNIPRVETKKRECWKFLDWRLNSENDSRVHGQPSFLSRCGCVPSGVYHVPSLGSMPLAPSDASLNSIHQLSELEDYKIMKEMSMED